MFHKSYFLLLEFRKMSLRVETFPELCDVSNWRFKAEGDANIVLSFVGKNGEIKRGVVLRLRKTNKLNNTTDTINVVNSNNQYIDQSYINSFIDIVMKPLIGKEYIGNSVSRKKIYIYSNFIEKQTNKQNIFKIIIIIYSNNYY
jgi:hypothetical protein